MAENYQYLDKNGVQTLWTKAKSTFGKIDGIFLGGSGATAGIINKMATIQTFNPDNLTIPGLVPAPGGSSSTAIFLRGDGTWAQPIGSTYSAATTTTDGLMSSSDKIELISKAVGNGKIYYGESNTAANVQQKQVTIDGITSYETGMIVIVRFANNTVDNITLNINNLGAKSISIDNQTGGATGNLPSYTFTAGTHVFLYNGASFYDISVSFKYGAGNGLKLNKTSTDWSIVHDDSITAGTVGPSASVSGTTVAVPYLTYNNTGHITAASSQKFEIPVATTSAPGVMSTAQVVKLNAATTATAFKTIHYLGTGGSFTYKASDDTDINIRSSDKIGVCSTANPQAGFMPADRVFLMLTHATSMSAAGTVGSTSNVSGTTMSVPYIVYDNTGHITGASTKKFAIPTATTAAPGVMSTAQVTTLNQLVDTVDGIISTGGQQNQDAFSYVNVAGANTTISASDPKDTFVLKGNGSVSLSASTVDNSITITGSTYGNATTAAAGLMSVDDKIKLNSVASSAEVNQNAFSKLTTVYNGSASTAAANSKESNIIVAGSDGIQVRAFMNSGQYPTLTIYGTGLASTAYVDETIATKMTGAAMFKSTATTASPSTAEIYSAGNYWLVGTAGTYVNGSIVCQPGDMIFATTGTTAANTGSTTHFTAIQQNLTPISTTWIQNLD